MTSATINGQTVDVEVIESDGSSGASLTHAEHALVTALDTYIRAHAAFVAAYPDARLVRVDSNRVLEDTEEGRIYLRYRHRGGVTELWGHRAGAASLDLERGIATVRQDPPR